MSKVKIQGNASGTGVVTLTAPNTNTDRTITLPDSTGSILDSTSTLDATKLSGTVPNFTSTGIDDNATSNAITIDASEVVGIGVTTPSTFSGYSALQLGDRTLLGNYPNDSAIFCHNGYSSAGWKYIETAAASRFELTGGGHRFQVAPSGTAGNAISWTNAMIINNNGNVLIGTTNQSPAETSTVSGMRFGNNGGSQMSAGSLEVLRINRFGTNGTSMTFSKNGGPVGSISVTDTAASYNTSSDYRLKENVVPMTGSIDRLKALKPSNFNFIADPDTTVDGFLAHEAQVVVPECVDGTKDAMRDEEYEVTPAVMDGNTVVTEAVMGTRSVPDYQGIDQSKLVPLLVASLQEAVAKIESLEARVTALEV